MNAQLWFTYLPWLWVATWHKNASKFFCEYIKFPQRAYTSAGNLIIPAMRQGAKFLLQEKSIQFYSGYADASPARFRSYTPGQAI